LSEEAQRAWRTHPEHRAAQGKGRDIYYETHKLQICELKREAIFDRKASEAAE
jgi:heme-degrading monooxygenase HmoA